MYRLEHAKAAGLTRERHTGPHDGGRWVTELSDVRRDTDGAVVANTRYGRRRGVEWTGRRCEDAPCCGCCD